MNTYSALAPGKACTQGRVEPYAVRCSSGEVIVVNLTDAYAPRLPSGLPDPTVPVSSRPIVTRCFNVDANMTQLTVIDSMEHSAGNVTWGLHTRATSISIHGNRVVLMAASGIRMEMRLESTPPGVCRDWQTALVKLSNGTGHNETRFPLYGARKVWSVCPVTVSELRVTLSDLPDVFV